MYSLTKLNRWLVRSPQMQEGYLPCPTSGMCVCMCVCVCVCVCMCVCVCARARVLGYMAEASIGREATYEDLADEFSSFSSSEVGGDQFVKHPGDVCVCVCVWRGKDEMDRGRVAGRGREGKRETGRDRWWW